MDVTTNSAEEQIRIRICAALVQLPFCFLRESAQAEIVGDFEKLQIVRPVQLAYSYPVIRGNPWVCLEIAIHAVLELCRIAKGVRVVQGTMHGFGFELIELDLFLIGLLRTVSAHFKRRTGLIHTLKGRDIAAATNSERSHMIDL